MGARLSAGVPPGSPAGYAAATSDPACSGVGGERRLGPSPADRTVPAGLGSSSLAAGNVSVASPRRPAPPPPRPTAHPGAAPSHLPRLTAATTRTSVTNAGPSRSGNITTAFPATREVSGEEVASSAPGGVAVPTASDSRGQINGLLETVQAWQRATRFALLTDLKCYVCHKTIPSDSIELHLLTCLTKPQLIYNEDVLLSDMGECSICFDELRVGNTIARLPCLCVYHKGCIDNWFTVTRCCPEHPDS